ncbi:MAG: carbon starvation CstA family protein [Verrucomicrobiota bacterium]
MIAIVFAACFVLFVLAYVFYGRFIEKRLDINPDRPTPAHTLKDDVDYVPTPTLILFGHHFSSIAGAGPIVGPIIAGLAFGWLPAILWIVGGAILVGGVHDFSALAASLRHQGRSVGELCRDLLSPVAYRLYLLFIWLTMMYIQIVFLDLTALTFAPLNPAAVENTDAVALTLRQGGTVATASLIYIILAVLFGFTIYRLKKPVWLGTLIYVPLVFAALWVGHVFPLAADKMPALLGSPKNTWLIVLMVYCFLAAVLPVWILLQPRDYLSSYLLYASVGGGALGVVFAGLTGKVTIQYPAFIGWSDPQLKFIFPALFVTIACGAVSGFHSIVASGTTAKQINRESAAKPVAYGAMLVEGLLAVLALAAVMILVQKPVGATPQVIFAQGLAQFLAPFGISTNAAVTFGLLAVSTFLLTTLDTCTRLARFIFEELFQLRGFKARIIGTAASLLLPALVVFRQVPGAGGKMMAAWQAIWPAFGTTNQLMAALALMVVFAWLFEEHRGAWFIVIPMVFMCVTTLTSLTQLVLSNLRGGSPLIGWLSLVLWVLAIALIIDTYFNLRKRWRGEHVGAST